MAPVAQSPNHKIDSHAPGTPAKPGLTRRNQYTPTQRMIYRTKQTAKDLHFALNHALLKNPSSRRLFAQQAPVLSDAQKRVVAEIQTQGLSMIHIDELTGDPACWRQLQELAANFVASEKVQRGIERYQQNIDQAQWKEYIVRLIGKDETLPLDHPLFTAATMPQILDTLNAALGLWTKLLDATLWYTIATDQPRDPMASQNWHRDPEDRNPIKLFLYFNRVDDTNGATQYIPASRAGQKYEHLWPLATGCGTRGYIPEETIQREVAPSDIITAAAGPGTLVFLDTSGFHRGGIAQQRERVMANWAYTTPASLHKRVFQLETQPRGDQYPPAHFALT